MNARLQREAEDMGDPEFLNAEEAEKATKMMDGTLLRSWNLWVAEIGPL